MLWAPSLTGDEIFIQITGLLSSLGLLSFRKDGTLLLPTLIIYRQILY